MSGEAQLQILTWTLIGTVITALIAATPPSILAYLSFKQSRISATAAITAKTEVVAVKVVVADAAEIINTAALKIDGRFDALVEDVRAVAFAAGKVAGTDEAQVVAAEQKRALDMRAQDRAEGVIEGRAQVQQPPPPISSGS